MGIYRKVLSPLSDSRPPIVHHIQNPVVLKADFVLLAGEIEEHSLPALCVLELAVVDFAYAQAVRPYQMSEKAVRDIGKGDFIGGDPVAFAKDHAKVDVVVLVNSDTGRPIAQHKEDSARQNQDDRKDEWFHMTGIIIKLNIT